MSAGVLPEWRILISKLNSDGRKKCMSSCKGLLSLHCIARGRCQLLRGWLTLRELRPRWHGEGRPHSRRWQTLWRSVAGGWSRLAWPGGHTLHHGRGHAHGRGHTHAWRWHTPWGHHARRHEHGGHPCRSLQALSRLHLKFHDLGVNEALRL